MAPGPLEEEAEETTSLGQICLQFNEFRANMASVTIRAAGGKNISGKFRACMSYLIELLGVEIDQFFFFDDLIYTSVIN